MLYVLYTPSDGQRSQQHNGVIVMNDLISGRRLNEDPNETAYKAL